MDFANGAGVYIKHFHLTHGQCHTFAGSGARGAKERFGTAHSQGALGRNESRQGWFGTGGDLECSDGGKRRGRLALKGP